MLSATSILGIVRVLSSGLFKGSGIRAIQVAIMEAVLYGGRVPSWRLPRYVLTLRQLPLFEILEVSGKQDRSNCCSHALWSTVDAFMTKM